MRLNYQNLKKNRNLELRKLCSFVVSVRHQLIMVPAQKKVNFGTEFKTVMLKSTTLCFRNDPHLF